MAAERRVSRLPTLPAARRLLLENIQWQDGGHTHVRRIDIPSRRFYATTGFPLKNDGEIPPDMAYLQSAKIAGLSNLSKDISLAARNALLEMIDYMTETYGLTAEQAYVVSATSKAVDSRSATRTSLKGTAKCPEPPSKWTPISP